MITASHSWPLPGRIEVFGTFVASSGNSTSSSLTSADDHHVTAAATAGETALNTPTGIWAKRLPDVQITVFRSPQTVWHQHRDTFHWVAECVAWSPADQWLVLDDFGVGGCACPRAHDHEAEVGLKADWKVRINAYGVRIDLDTSIIDEGA
jgi:hypothetical protein